MNDNITEHLQRLEHAGDERGRLIASISNKIDSINKWRPTIDRKLEKHDHFLFGNGEPGIDEVLRNIDKWINEQKEEKSKTKQIDKEITLLGIKTTAETKVAIIQGIITLAGIALTALLVSK